jgi:hypothetical protein
MKTKLRAVVIAAVAAAAFGTVFAPLANAGCVSPDEKGGSWRLTPSLAPAADTSMVGFWHVDFVAEGNTNGIPDGTPIDSAYVQWHSDGTEVMNSSRDPRTGSFCLGVWKRTGNFTYVLKHFALSWNNDGTPQGPATIVESVTLAHSGDTFTGNFTITQYATDGITVIPPTPIVGTLTGARITAN